MPGTKIKLIILVFVLVTSIPLRLQGLDLFMPLFIPMVVYYFALYNIEFASIYFFTLLGFFQDIMYGGHFGINALINFIFYLIIVSQRKILTKEPFPVIWLGFTISSFSIIIINSLVNYILYRRFIFSNAQIMQFLLSASIYPVIHMSISKLLNIVCKQQD